ncbi:CG3436-like protein [Phlyctochytrium arcticum]|nr:CG3436-like protein [Phlyctochytrium arcticum]
MADKRKADDPFGALIKKAKSDADASTSLVTASIPQRAVIRTVKRTSDLQAPIMLLSGHEGEVFTCRFSPRGRLLASGSFDRMIYLWETHGECKNVMSLKGHTGAIMEVNWSSDEKRLYSASTDKSIGAWDVETGERIKKMRGHESYVNSVASSKRGNGLVVSGSDDGSVKIWDPLSKHPIKSFENKYPITATCISDDGGMVFAGGIDNQIRAWDLRKDEVSYTLSGHFDTITGLRISPDGDSLLSNAMDNTVRIWDVKPFAAAGTRLQRIFEGAPHGFEKNLIRPCWSPDGDYIASGSGDRSVVVWDVSSQRIVYKLPGHKGVCNQVDWTDTIIASASNDRTLFIGELNVQVK